MNGKISLLLVLVVCVVSGLVLAADDGEKADKAKDEEKAESKLVMVKLETNMGDIVLELDAEKSPVTVENFLRYVNEKFYDGVIFHSVIKGFMIQGGGFESNMKRKETHGPIKNEASNCLRNDRGTIAMARTSDPNSATAQIFINHKNNNSLNYVKDRNAGYAVFGKVITGMDVVDRIAAVETRTWKGMGDVPVDSVIIKTATVVKEKCSADE
jgi:cyclophilin family peptidyl-prolyl cis-trans isomerase